nr:Crp/Fnr family transcriptional regulator [Alkalihalobacterium alkalinitrilicum]
MHIKKGDHLFQEGVQAKEIYLIKSGKVQISKIVSGGKELILRICAKEEIIGELTLLAEDPKYLLNAKVIEDTEVGVINREILEEAFLRDSRLAFEYMKWMGDHFRRTQTRFHDLILSGKKGAVITTLIRLSNSFGRTLKNGILIELYLTNQTLGKFCGTTREQVNRILSELRKDNIISIEMGYITIHDMKYLRDEVGCDNCAMDLCTIG